MYSFCPSKIYDDKLIDTQRIDFMDHPVSRLTIVIVSFHYSPLVYHPFIFPSLFIL